MSRMLSGSTRNQHDVVPPPQRITMVATSASTIIRTVPKLSIQSMTNLLAELPALPQNSTLIPLQAEEPKERQERQKGRKGRKDRKAGKACGGNNSPRAPLFLPPGFAGSAGQGERDYARSYGRGECSERQRLRGMVCSAGAARAADSVQVCPHGPTCGGRLLSGLRRTVVSKERISRCFGEKTSRAVHADWKMFSQRSGERGRHQKPASTTASSRNSLPALSAAAVVQAMQPVQRVLCKRKMAAAGRSNVSGRRGNLHVHPKMLRDGPARVRPANYGGSGEIISPDAFPVFPVFSAFLPFLSYRAVLWKPLST